MTLLTRYNATIASPLSTGESAEVVADPATRLARDPEPQFSYQSSDIARTIARQKFADPAGVAVISAMSALVGTR